MQKCYHRVNVLFVRFPCTPKVATFAQAASALNKPLIILPDAEATNNMKKCWIHFGQQDWRCHLPVCARGSKVQKWRLSCPFDCSHHAGQAWCGSFMGRGILPLLVGSLVLLASLPLSHILLWQCLLAPLANLSGKCWRGTNQWKCSEIAVWQNTH